MRISILGGMRSMNIQEIAISNSFEHEIYWLINLARPSYQQKRNGRKKK